MEQIIYDIELKQAVDRFFEKLSKYYPEHKIFALGAIDDYLRERLSELYKKAGYSSADEFLSAYGYETISGDEIRKIRNQVIYTPGNEPEIIKNKVESMLKRLNEYYPQRVVKALQEEHKSLASDVSGLYRWLGYSSTEEMLKAYGFEVAYKAHGRTASNDYLAIMDFLKEKYKGDNRPKSFGEIVEDNPELAGKIKSLQNKSNELFGMSLVKYLKEIGIIVPVAAPAKEPKPKKKKTRYYLVVSVDDVSEPVMCAVEKQRNVDKGDYIKMKAPGSEELIAGCVTEYCAVLEDELPMPLEEMYQYARKQYKSEIEDAIIAKTNYIFCEVKVGGYTYTRYYISPFKDIKIGDIVEVGHDSNSPVYGVVAKVNPVFGKDAPVPVKGTEYIERIVEREKNVIKCSVMNDGYISAVSCVSLFEDIEIGDVVEVGRGWNSLTYGVVTGIKPVTEKKALINAKENQFIRKIVKRKKDVLICSVGIEGYEDAMCCISLSKDVEIGDIVEVRHNLQGPVYSVVTEENALVSAEEIRFINRIVRRKKDELEEAKGSMNILIAKNGTEDFEKSIAVASDIIEQFKKTAYFCGAVFRGLEQDANNALSYIYPHGDALKHKTNVGNIVQFECNSAAVPYIIKNYPNLKAVFFAEDWRKGMVYLGYSESGYSTVTVMRQIGKINLYSREDRWTLYHDPTEENISAKNIKYDFLEKSLWEKCDYVLPEGDKKLIAGEPIESKPYPKAPIKAPCEIIEIRYPKE